ncbi:MAG: SpoIIE family protein phosphatase [Anaerovoracaceae bacterium]
MPIINNKNLMYQVIENMTGMVRIMDSENNILYMNKTMKVEFGDFIGRKCHTMLCSDDRCDTCISEMSIKSGHAEMKEVWFGDKLYRIMASPATETGENTYSIEIFQDITEQRKLEEQYRKHYEKLKDDIEFAKQVQWKALPRDGVYWSAIRTYSAYAPSEDLSGDTFDIMKADDDNCIFYIADVSGHGVRSSLLTISLRQTIRGMKAAAADHAAVLYELIEGYHELGLDKEQFVSLLYGVYNKKTRGLSLFNAGHNCPPIILENGKKEKSKITEIELKGMPICSLLSSPNHQIKTFQMEKGDKILLYTDGITEACNKEKSQAFGISGLKKVIHKLGVDDGKALTKGIIEEAEEFAGGSPMDDMAVLLLELL